MQKKLSVIISYKQRVKVIISIYSNGLYFGIDESEYYLGFC